MRDAVKFKRTLFPFFILVFLSSLRPSSSGFHFYFLSTEKVPSSLQSVDFKAPLAENCWPLGPAGVSVNGRPCVGCI